MLSRCVFLEKRICKLFDDYSSKFQKDTILFSRADSLCFLWGALNLLNHT